MLKSSKSSRKAPSEAAKALQPRAPSAAKISVKSLHAETKAAPRGPRRAIFIDVENTSSETALIAALDQLQVDRALTPTELVAVGNWRVIGHHVARMLAQRGARLLHTAPATGVKDWSDLSIAVAVGIWLGRADPGDQVDIVSADRAFDAIADSAVSLGVKFRRLTYGPTSGLAEAITPTEAASTARSRSRRGGRGRRRRPASEGWAAPAAVPAAANLDLARSTATPAATNGPEKDIEAAPPEHVIATIARLIERHPERGVNLDLLINALKEEGYGRPPGSPRLVTRLRKLKGVEVSPTGMVRLVGPPSESAGEELRAMEAANAEPAPEEAAAPPPRTRRSRRRGGRGRSRAPSSPPASEVS